MGIVRLCVLGIVDLFAGMACHLSVGILYRAVNPAFKECLVVSPTFSKVTRTLASCRTVFGGFFPEIKDVWRDDKWSVVILYCYFSFIGFMFTTYFRPSLAGYSTVGLFVFSLTMAFVVIPLLITFFVLTLVLLYLTCENMIHASYEFRRNRRYLRIAIWYAWPRYWLFSGSRKKFRWVPLYATRQEPLADFVRFEKLKFCVLRSYDFAKRVTQESQSKSLLAIARRVQALNLRRLETRYRALLDGVVKEYGRSLGKDVLPDETESVWLRPDYVHSIYSLCVLERYVAVDGSLLEENLRPAAHERLVFSPAWVCDLVFAIERNHGKSLQGTLRFWREKACTPMQGADRETVLRLYEPAGPLGDLKTLVDVATLI